MNKQWREEEDNILKVEENGNWMDGSKNMNNESEGTDIKLKKDKTEQILKFRVSLARGVRYKVTGVWEKRQQTSKISDVSEKHRQISTKVHMAPHPRELIC